VRISVIKASGALNEAAYHEAGHVVIAHAVNLLVNYARVVQDQESKRWGGGIKATPRMDNSELDNSEVEAHNAVIAASKAKESVAGMLAQAKFIAGQQVGSDLATFNVAMEDFEDLWSLLRIKKMHGTIRLEFVDSGKTVHPLVFEANECLISVEDRENFNQYVSGHPCLGRVPPDETDEQLVIETMKLLDREDCWNKVHIMVNALINDGLGRCLVKNDIMPFLAAGVDDAAKISPPA